MTLDITGKIQLPAGRRPVVAWSIGRTVRVQIRRDRVGRCGPPGVV